MFENHRYTKKNRPRRSILNSTLKMRKWYHGGAVPSPFAISDDAPLPHLVSAQIPEQDESPPPETLTAPVDTVQPPQPDTLAAPVDTVQQPPQPDTLAAPVDTVQQQSQSDTLTAPIDTTQSDTIVDTTQPPQSDPTLETTSLQTTETTLNIDYNDMMNTPDIQAAIQTLTQKIADYLAIHMPK